MKFIPQKKPYHYTECGLSWVMLDEGVSFSTSPYGKAVTFANAEAVDRIIAKHLLLSPIRMTGMEVNFLRALADATRDDIGTACGLSSAQVMEMIDNHGMLEPAQDMAIRSLMAWKIGGEALLDALMDFLANGGAADLLEASAKWPTVHYKNGEIQAAA